jgi:molybdenum cofactor biosynthesis protein B
VSSPADEHRSYAPSRLGFAYLTVSDSRTAKDDDSGRAVARALADSPHELVASHIRPDEAGPLRIQIEGLLSDPAVDVVVVSGGTGISPRDVTVEAVTPLFDRDLPGFGELFRQLSYEQIGPAAMLSRAAAGIVDGRVIFLLPGSPKAVELAMARLILPEVAHIVGQARRPRR